MTSSPASFDSAASNSAPPRRIASSPFRASETANVSIEKVISSAAKITYFFSWSKRESSFMYSVGPASFGSKVQPPIKTAK